MMDIKALNEQHISESGCGALFGVVLAAILWAGPLIGWFVACFMQLSGWRFAGVVMVWIAVGIALAYLLIKQYERGHSQ